ncbi:MAG TPA: prepilin-type N-terminal cleavage/methylation domain-containing protein [Chthoniobacterales bacterium]|nr:prepilin-type N-terminal cleavage/methylation domain-containing protein [Chthoniobacterales bacterium]
MKTRAFTLIELLVVIAIIATIAAFAVPALTSALAKGQMTGTMNNARQLYLAGYQMALDGSANADANLAWPGDYTSGISNLQDYVQKLVQNDYLKASDLSKILSAPGATCTATSSGSGSSTVVTLSGNSGIKIYPVTSADGSNAIFAATSNYTYDTDFASSSGVPYGDKGFVVVRKGGDAAVLRKSNAKAIAGQEASFESLVGKKPGEAQGTVTPGDPAGVLKQP